MSSDIAIGDVRKNPFGNKNGLSQFVRGLDAIQNDKSFSESEPGYLNSQRVEQKLQNFQNKLEQKIDELQETMSRVEKALQLSRVSSSVKNLTHKIKLKQKEKSAPQKSEKFN